MAEDAHQSLYRRYRPARFSEVLGQDHVTKALRNSVASGRIAHAYLFSGPRGTGKTSTARILAKALNCEKAADGEPCCACDSCTSVAAGSSLDVHELDAASNNGVEAMRDLVARAALSSPGRWKVYIIDEVHMLSTAASNALLKTLEEPPGSVIFVLATTDPQKVLPTIRSRTQHYEFHLLSPEILGDLVAGVTKDAGLEVPAELFPAVVRRAHGSARDALSALDQVSAAGVVDDSGPIIGELVEAIVGRDAPEALRCVAGAVSAGRDPQVLAVEVLERMRQGFLASLAPDLVDLEAQERDAAAAQVRNAGLAAFVRAMETLGRAQIDMRSAVDPRVTLEVALVRITKPEVDVTPEALAERLERIESTLASGTPFRSDMPERIGPQHDTERPVPREPERAPPPAVSPEPGSAARALQSRYGGSGARPVERTGATEQIPGDRGAPTRDELTQAWGDSILASLPTKARSRYKVGRFVEGDPGCATFALPNEVHRSYCEQQRGDVQSALRAHFGTAVELVLVVETDAPAQTGGARSPDEQQPRRAPRARAGSPPQPRVADHPEQLDEAELMDDPSQLRDQSEVEADTTRLIMKAFPGAQTVTGSAGGD